MKKLPLAISGLMLALAALGNLLLSYGEEIQIILYILSFIIFISITFKIVLDLNGFKEELKNPVTASIFPTYSMSLMLYGGFLGQTNKSLATILWYLGLVIHVILIIYFTLNFAVNYKKVIVFPSWFIVYVGIVVASVTAKNFNVALGKGAFVFGLASLIILLFLTMNNIRNNNFPEPTKPLLAIMTAPASLCVTGYMNIFDNKNIYFLIGLLVIAQLLYFYVFVNLFNLLKLKFYPSFSGFTFPLVISAIGLKLSINFFANNGFNVSRLKYLVLFETLMATIIVLYVSFKYLKFLKPTRSIEKEKESL